MAFRHVLIRSARLGLTILCLAVLLLYGIGAAVEFNTSQAEAARTIPVGQMYDIGGRRLNLYCLGQPDPDQVPVILVADAGESLYFWWNLQHQLSSSGEVCAYDRSGYGWSEVAPQPRSGAALAEELQALLAAAGIQPPFILVGHGLGGLVARQFTLDFPDEVQGLVLVESKDAESIARMPVFLRKPLLMLPAVERGAGAVLQTAGVLRLMDRWGSLEISPALAQLPDEELPAARAVYFNPRRLATAARELAALAETASNQVDRKLPGDLPIISLLASPANGQEPSPEIFRDFMSLSSNSQVRQLPEVGDGLPHIAPVQVLHAIWELQSR